jgi:predicted acyl esterase
MNIGDSIIPARHRDSLAKATLMRPGQVYEVTINLSPTANLFKKGHRIRVDISSSNFPRLDINPNTGEPLQLTLCIPYSAADHSDREAKVKVGKIQEVLLHRLPVDF